MNHTFTFSLLKITEFTKPFNLINFAFHYCNVELDKKKNCEILDSHFRNISKRKSVSNYFKFLIRLLKLLS